MKMTSVVAVLLALCAVKALAGNYVLRIDGKEVEIDLGTNTSITLGDGRTVAVKLMRTAVAEFRTDNFSFSHPNHVAPTRTDLGDGMHQTTMMTPSGTMILIQEHAGTNPSGLVDFMLTQLLKEEVQYGYKVSNTAASKKLADGKTVTGKRAVSRYRTDEYDRHVLGYGIRDAGILIVTQVGEDAPSQDLAMLDLFWKSMRITIK